MTKSVVQTRKYINCYDLPPNFRQIFFEIMREFRGGYQNGVVVHYEIGLFPSENDEEEEAEIYLKIKSFDNFLMSLDIKKGEDILISHWW